ncbi:MAG: hypothetical protein QHH17_04670 [Candidatus Bathyarchaeota archaeon]|nr:hypothetical protein [Candidatus Bathyarchaeota archaeon]
MKRTLLLTVSAVLCGILVMFVPWYLWYQANFPYEPLALLNFREKSLEYYKAQWALLERTPITPFYITLAISFAISIIAYTFLKRRL